MHQLGSFALYRGYTLTGYQCITRRGILPAAAVGSRLSRGRSRPVKSLDTFDDMATDDKQEDSKPTRGHLILSEQFFYMACEAAETAGKDELNDIAHTVTMRCCATAVILSVATLEAFLNESLEFWDAPTAPLKTLDEVVDKASMGDRWELVPYIMLGKTFDKGVEPFQSFKALVQLRNALVHYDPRGLHLHEGPRKLEDVLQGKFKSYSQRPPQSEVTFAWQHRVLSSACARWACRTAQWMIQELEAMRGRSNPWGDVKTKMPSGGDIIWKSPWRTPPSEPK